MAHEGISIEAMDDRLQRIIARENNTEMGFLEIEVKEGTVIAYHTEVYPAGEGKGWGKKLFEALIAFARAEQLKLVPLCPFVQARLKKNPEEYTDVYPGKQV